MAMTFSLIEGFDKYTSLADDVIGAGGKWGSGQITGLPCSISLTAGRLGTTGALNAVVTGQSTSNYAGIRHIVKNGPVSSLYVGMAVMFNELPAGQPANFLRFWLTSSFLNRTVAIASDGTLCIGNGSSVQVSSSTVVATGEWNWIEVYITQGGVFKVYLNGNLVINTTGQHSVTDLRGIVIGCSKDGGATNQTSNLTIDDVYVGVPSSEADGPLGDSRVELLEASGVDTAGTWGVEDDSLGLTADEVVNDWDPDTYIYSDAVDDEILFDSDSELEGNPVLIHTVAVNVRAAKTDVGLRTIKPIIEHDSVVKEGSEVFLGEAVAQEQVFFNSDGNNDPWNKAAVESALFGVKVEQ